MPFEQIKAVWMMPPLVQLDFPRNGKIELFYRKFLLFSFSWEKKANSWASQKYVKES